MAEWISVNDRLPKNNLARVLVFLKDDEFTKPIGMNKIDTDRCIDGKWMRWGEHVSHWMELPQPPRTPQERGGIMDVLTDGLKHDGGKARLDLVPAELIEAVGIVMTHGAEKYGEASYRKVEPKRYRAALMRHICKWLKDPHGIDEDSGLPHLWHIACNVAFLLELDKEENHNDNND